MGIFSRIGSLFKSNINDMISKAEDPEKMLNQVLVDMKGQLVEAKKQVAVAIADEKRLKKQYEDEASKGQDWERKAMMAVRAGDDELAREALARKTEHDEHTGTMEAQWMAQKTAVDQLKDQLRMLNSKIEEASRKKNILIARKKRAEAQKTIHETMAGLNDTSAFDTFDRMANKIDQLEAEAEANAEVSEQLTGNNLEQRFKKLEAGSGSEHALLELKAKMGMLPEHAGDKVAGELPAAAEAAPEKSSVDAELEALKAKLGKE